MTQKIRLVTFLGIGGYEPVRYVWTGADGEVRVAGETRYVARALAELLGATEVVALATAQAESTHGEGLRAELAAARPPLPELDLRRIPLGRAPEELWAIFEELARALRFEGEVVLDITHGFRAQPFFGAAVVSFLRAVEERLASLRIVYGAFEQRDLVSGEAPVWDVTTFVELVDWSSALLLFLKTGRAEDVSGPTERLGRELRKQWALSGKRGPEPALAQLGKALAAFGDDLVTVRTGSLLLGRELEGGSALRLVQALRAARAEVTAAIPPLASVLDRIEAAVAPLAACGPGGGPQELARPLCTAEGHAALAALAKLYLDMGRHAEAAATVIEGWQSLYADDGGAGPGTGACTLPAREQAQGRWFEDVGVARQLSQLRDDMLHAGYRVDPRPPGTIKQELRDLAARFEGAGRPGRELAGAEPARAVFVNVSNCPSARWAAAQVEAARAYAPEIVDVPFPDVTPDAGGHELEGLARSVCDRVPAGATHAMVMGELTLTALLVKRLQARGVICLATAGPRLAEVGADGVKTSRFEFVRFREYPRLGT